MTAFWTFLTNLTAADWLLLLIAWLPVAFSLGTFTGLAIKRADDDGSWTHLTVSQPPVPESDAGWLDAWPAGDEDETDLRFQQIIAAEGLS